MIDNCSIPSDAKSFFHVEIEGVKRDDFFDKLDTHMCTQVGHSHVRPSTNASIAELRVEHSLAQIELAWGSYVHKLPKQEENKKNKGTVHMYCLFTLMKITSEHVEWWVRQFILRNVISHANITVRWMGAQSERDIYASGQTIRENNPPLQIGLRDRAINSQRSRLALLGDTGTLRETDGRKVEGRVRGGYLHNRYYGELWSRDCLAEIGDLPILINDQIPLADDITRGFPSYNDYKNFQLSTHQQCVDLLNFVTSDICTLAKDNRISREEISNRSHIARQAIQWFKDMGVDGILVEATVTARRENNRDNWNIGTYNPGLPGHTNVIVDSSIDA